MNVEKTKEKLNKLNDSDLDNLFRLIQTEYINRGRTTKSNVIISNFTSNTTHSPEQQSASLSQAFENAWIHG